jgi:hypothetical protein
MLPLIIYALVVFFLCLILIRLLNRKLPVLLIVGLCTVISPVLMQALNTLIIGYLDPFWEWATFMLGLIALVASLSALAFSAALEEGPEKQ